ADGFIRNIVRVDGDGNDYEVNFTSKAENVNLSLEGVPFPINNLRYGIDYSERRLFIRELRTSLESGSVFLKGDIFFDDGEPDVNIKYQLDRAELPIMGKSVINVSGEGIVLGNNPPYTVGGELVINKA